MSGHVQLKVKLVLCFFLFLVILYNSVVTSRSQNVRSFAVHCNGMATDTDLIQAAANAIPDSGGELSIHPGVCRITKTVFIKSNTVVKGNDTTLLATLPWKSETLHGFAIIENKDFDATIIKNENIVIRDLTLDYGEVASLKTPNGGKHAIRLQKVRNASIDHNIFILRGAEDAFAGLGVQAVQVMNNQAFDFRNCAYDFWAESSDIKVFNNYAETETSAQVVNFNPEHGSGDVNDEKADTFFLQKNVFVVTGNHAAPLQIEPLGPHTSVNNVVIQDNILMNAYIVMRGSVFNAVVTDNTISNVAGGAPAFVSYPNWNGVGKGIKFSRNLILFPRTQPEQFAVIRMEATASAITHNRVFGETYKSHAIYTNGFPVVVDGNVLK